jgi:hypothetical protein
MISERDEKAGGRSIAAEAATRSRSRLGAHAIGDPVTDLNSLVVFAKVVKAGSFSEAARRLKMPISTVTAASPNSRINSAFACSSARPATCASRSWERKSWNRRCGAPS